MYMLASYLDYETLQNKLSHHYGNVSRTIYGVGQDLFHGFHRWDTLHDDEVKKRRWRENMNYSRPDLEWKKK